MVDLTFLEKFTKGDSSKMKRYINMYLSETPLILEKMEEFLAKEDWSSLAIYAHSLKPQAEFMGIDALKQILAAIEKNAKTPSRKVLDELYNEASRVYTQSSKILKQYNQNP